MEIGPGSSIKWGVYREGVRFQLPRFESLKREGPALIQAYQDVLDKDETFTQYFSDERLQSYDLESNLRTLLGIRPPLVDEPQGSDSQSDVSLSWVNIFRHGKFEKRDDGFYQCRMQGRLVKIDETMHKTILVNRCFLPPNSDPYVSAADVEKESEVNLSIEADVLNELHIQIKYVERLKRLQQSLKKRRHRLRGDQAPASIKRSGTPQSLRSNYPSPTESGLRLPVLSHAASDSQSGSRVSISVEPSVGLTKPAASIESQEAQGRSASPSSSDVSTGEDIPFSRDHNSLKRKNMSSDFETVDVDWDTQHQTPAPCNASTPLVSASKGKEPLAPEERDTMVDDSYAVAESRGTTAEGRDTTVGDSDAVVADSDAMEVDGPSEVPKPVAPIQHVKQPPPKPETPRKSKRTLNWAASSLRQEYENAGQPIDLTSSPAPSFEAMQFGSDIAGRQGGIAPVPPRTGTVSMKIKPKKAKSHKKGVRVRNNFTQEEFDHAPAWLKPRLDAGMSPAKLEQEYEAKFGVLHRYNTLKLWLDRQEAKASPIKAPNTRLASTLTKIVPTPEYDRAMPSPAVSSFRPINPSPYVSPYPRPLSSEPNQASLMENMPPSAQLSTPIPTQSSSRKEHIPPSAMPPSAELPTPKSAHSSSLTKIMPSSVAHSTPIPAQSSLLTGNMPSSAERSTSMPTQSSSLAEKGPSTFQRPTPMPNGLPNPE